MATKKKTTEKKEVVKAEAKVIDASGMTLGRVATVIATNLLGKNRTVFERNVYSGVPVTVINASKIRMTPQKMEELNHKRYSGYPGGLRTTKASETVEKKGWGELVKLAVYRMLPDNRLRREMMKNLKVEN